MKLQKRSKIIHHQLHQCFFLTYVCFISWKALFFMFTIKTHLFIFVFKVYKDQFQISTFFSFFKKVFCCFLWQSKNSNFFAHFCLLATLPLPVKGRHSIFFHSKKIQIYFWIPQITTTTTTTTTTTVSLPFSYEVSKIRF